MALTVAAAAIALGGGVTVGSGAARISARTPAIPAAIALLLSLALLAWRRGAVLTIDLPAAWNDLARAAPVVNLLAACAIGALACAWGTFAVGGSDSHCYVAQAHLFAQGRVALDEPLGREAPWPNAALTVAPVGFVPSAAAAGRAVPICPPGLALAMAPLSLVGSGAAVFWLVPLFAALGVLATAALGTRLGGPIAGSVGAALTAASPIVVFQAVQPMSDVPAMAAWCAAAASVLRGGASGAFAGGAATAVAIAMRPNLFPLGAVLGAAVLFDPRMGRDRVRRALIFSGPAALGPLVVGALQWAMHGSPLRSGYGSLSVLFAWSHVFPNLSRYPAWFVETHTAVPLLGAAAAVVPGLARAHGEGSAIRRWSHLVLLAMALVTLVCYLPYVVFDEWWYLRFLLPAVPLVMALFGSALVGAVRRLPTAARAPAVVVTVLLLVGFSAVEISSRRVTALAGLEQRFPATGRYLDSVLPEDAVVLTVQQSGAVRYYSGRSVVLWDSLDPAWLDRAVQYLAERGRPPFLLLESAEEDRFRTRFTASTFGRLDWPPTAQIGAFVRLFDPADRGRYHAGTSVTTTRVPVGGAIGPMKR